MQSWLRGPRRDCEFQNQSELMRIHCHPVWKFRQRELEFALLLQTMAEKKKIDFVLVIQKAPAVVVAVGGLGDLQVERSPVWILIIPLALPISTLLSLADDSMKVELHFVIFVFCFSRRYPAPRQWQLTSICQIRVQRWNCC